MKCKNDEISGDSKEAAMTDRRIFLIVLDSYGIGELPDAKEFGDEGCNTLRSITGSKEYDTPFMKEMGFCLVSDYSPRELLVSFLCL